MFPIDLDCFVGNRYGGSEVMIGSSGTNRAAACNSTHSIPFQRRDFLPAYFHLRLVLKVGKLPNNEPVLAAAAAA